MSVPVAGHNGRIGVNCPSCGRMNFVYMGGTHANFCKCFACKEIFSKKKALVELETYSFEDYAKD